MLQFNRALLGKWLCRFAMERDALWRQVVDIKYGSMMGSWGSKEVGGSFGVGEWQCIRRGWDAFAAHVRYEVGNGSLILFWHDVWCEDLPLKLIFPELFTIACGKGTWVEDNMQRQNGNILLNILFTQPVHDWEVEVVSRIFEMYSFKVRCEGEDKICWIPARRKSFEVKSYYKVLSSPIQSSFPWKCI